MLSPWSAGARALVRARVTRSLILLVVPRMRRGVRDRVGRLAAQARRSKAVVKVGLDGGLRRARGLGGGVSKQVHAARCRPARSQGRAVAVECVCSRNGTAGKTRRAGGRRRAARARTCAFVLPRAARLLASMCMPWP